MPKVSLCLLGGALSVVACDRTASPECEGDESCESTSGDGDWHEGTETGGTTSDGSATGGGGGSFGSGGTFGDAAGGSDGGAASGSGGDFGEGGAGNGTGGANENSVVVGSDFCSQTSWTVSEGYFDNGTICGHAWTYTHATDASVEPPCDGGPCFTGSELCISGELPGAEFNSEILFGFNTAQERDAGGPSYFALGGSGVTVDFTRGGFDGEVRLILDGEENYCATLTSGKRLNWADFSVGCWEEGPMSPVFVAGTEVKALLLQLNNTENNQSFSGFCVDRITIHPLSAAHDPQVGEMR